MGEKDITCHITLRKKANQIEENIAQMSTLRIKMDKRKHSLDTNESSMLPFKTIKQTQT